MFLYDAVLVVQAIGPIRLKGAALRDGLIRDAKPAATMREGKRNGHGAVALYAPLSIMALWFPLAAAIPTTLSWIFWFALGFRFSAVRAT